MREGLSVGLFSELEESSPVGVRLLEVDLVVVRLGDRVHVLSSRCPHRGASLADATVEDGSLVCAEHGWDFRCESGESATLPGECVHHFESWIDEETDRVLVAPDELRRVLQELQAELSYVL